VGQVGTGFISHVHVRALQSLEQVEVVCQHSLDPEAGQLFHEQYGVPEFLDSYEAMLARKDVDVVCLGVPNHLHHPFALQALAAGKHVIVEKPLCLTLAQADEMIAKSRESGLLLGYAEELCYVPKYVHAKRVADGGGLGEVFFVRQHEKHAGAYSPWFFQAETAGGGILMDMGCHAIECCRWLLGKPQVASVYCQADLFVHREITELDDHVILIIEFASGQIAEVESSWTLQGGMISHVELQGTEGVLHAELLQNGSGLRVFSKQGYEAGFPGGETEGWHYPDVEWLWQNGYPQEMADFIGCIRSGGTPTETAADGRAVLEIMIAGYLSAAAGRKVTFPFDDPGDYEAPVELWLRARRERGA
jgi:predicted dehydrogenase